MLWYSVVFKIRLLLGMHVFKILCSDKKWEIKLCISVNNYHRLLETWYEYSVAYHKTWEILHLKIRLKWYDLKIGNKVKLCISVNIYHRLLKLGMSTHVFKINLCYDKPCEINLCISVNIYHRLPKLGMSSHGFNISLCYDQK